MSDITLTHTSAMRLRLVKPSGALSGIASDDMRVISTFEKITVSQSTSISAYLGDERRNLARKREVARHPETI